MNRRVVMWLATVLILVVLAWPLLSLGASSRPALAASPQLASASTVAFQVGVEPAAYSSATDTYLDTFSRGQPQGGNAKLRLRSDGLQRALIRFDMSGYIPIGSAVTSATLIFRVDSRSPVSSAPMRLQCYEVLQPWVDQQATWNEAQSGVSWWDGSGDAGGCEGSSRAASPVTDVLIDKPAGAFIELDVTQAVQGWVNDPATNNGLLLLGKPAGGAANYSLMSCNSISPVGRPRLVVTYQDGIAPPTLTPAPGETPATATPTLPSDPSAIVTSTLTDWGPDKCKLKVWADKIHVREAGPAQMIAIWDGTVASAKLRLVVCNTGNPHSIYLNGVRIGRTPYPSPACECNDGPRPEPTEFQIDPSLIIRGSNVITITNDGNIYDTWNAQRGQLVLTGNITGTSRSQFPIGQDWNGKVLNGLMQLPIGYDPATPMPLLISVPGTGEDEVDAINRYAVRANDMGWLLASLDLRKGWASDSASVSRSASLAVQHDIMAVVQHMLANYNVDASRVYIAGFSTGGGIAATMAAKYPDVFAAALDYAGPTEYAAWYGERADLRSDLDRQFGGAPSAKRFEYQRRSSKVLARNLQYVPMRVVHGQTDTTVRPTHSDNLFAAMGSFFDPAAHGKTLIAHEGGHVDWVKDVTAFDLATLGEHTLVTNPSELHLVTDEGKSYYWLTVSKSGVADGAWEGFVEIDARYDAPASKIWIDARDGDFPQGKPLRVTLDLIKMGLNSSMRYAIEEYDHGTGEFVLHSDVLPENGELALAVSPNTRGEVNRSFFVHRSDDRVLRTAVVYPRDTYISSAAPGTPNGTASQLLLSYDLRYKALFEFDVLLPELAGMEIKSARFSVNLLESRNPISVGIYDALRPWSDVSATWNVARQGDAWQSPGADGPADRASIAYTTHSGVGSAGRYLLNVKSLVDRWRLEPAQNHGFFLIGNGPYTTSKYPIASAEYGQADKRPVLEIQYMEPEPDPTPTPTATPTQTPTSTLTPTVTPTLTLSPTPTTTTIPDLSWRAYLPLLIK